MSNSLYIIAGQKDEAHRRLVRPHRSHIERRHSQRSRSAEDSQEEGASSQEGEDAEEGSRAKHEHPQLPQTVEKAGADGGFRASQRRAGRSRSRTAVRVAAGSLIALSLPLSRVSAILLPGDDAEKRNGRVDASLGVAREDSSSAFATRSGAGDDFGESCDFFSE